MSRIPVETTQFITASKGGNDNEAKIFDPYYRYYFRRNYGRVGDTRKELSVQLAGCIRGRDRNCGSLYHK